jgi:aspartyl-tRNA(Asn)/glutamyl-tRNA(Gln) amidotransferase subunit A
MTEWHEKTALELGRHIERGRIDPRELTEYFLSRAEAHPEGDKIYMRLTRKRAAREAEAASDRAKRGMRLSPLDGVPISWKDLFDSEGVPTEGGSLLLKGRVPDKDAAVLARAAAAGLICLGKTSMTEFAFSGLGYNPTCGSPTNPFDPVTPRAPGGSSGGAAVSVATGLAAAAIGSDTGGSVRIPAAWNNLVGLKSTFGAIPLDGVLPLSPTLDTIGPLTKDVADANALFGILSNRPIFDLGPPELCDMKLALAKNETLWSTVDDDCWPVIDHALELLRQEGAQLPPFEIKQVDEFLTFATSSVNPVAHEAYEAWGQDIEARPELVYSEVRDRILLGKGFDQQTIAAAAEAIAKIRSSYLQSTEQFDAILLPTAGFVPPEIEALTYSPENYRKINGSSLFNTFFANQFGLCAITLPIGMTARTGRHPPMPVGLMAMAHPNQEEKLLSIALTFEKVFEKLRNT